MIQPKDRVDILITYSANGPQSQLKRTKLVLDYVEVFAVDDTRDLQNSEANKGAAAKNISFLVTPKENIRLSLAEKKGELQISLRNPDDKEKSTIDVFDEKDLNEAKIEHSEPQVTDGSYQPENPPPPQPAKAPLEDFLKEAQGQPGASPVNIPSNKKTWTISIFEKDQRRDAVIEEAPEELAALTGHGAASDSVAQPSLLDNVRDLFKKPDSKPAPVQQKQ